MRTPSVSRPHTHVFFHADYITATAVEKNTFSPHYTTRLRHLGVQDYHQIRNRAKRKKSQGTPNSISLRCTVCRSTTTTSTLRDLPCQKCTIIHHYVPSLGGFAHIITLTHDHMQSEHQQQSTSTGRQRKTSIITIISLFFFFPLYLEFPFTFSARCSSPRGVPPPAAYSGILNFPSSAHPTVRRSVRTAPASRRTSRSSITTLVSRQPRVHRSSPTVATLRLATVPIATRQ